VHFDNQGRVDFIKFGWPGPGWEWAGTQNLRKNFYL
jgi:hypothetical protein